MWNLFTVSTRARCAVHRVHRALDLGAELGLVGRDALLLRRSARPPRGRGRASAVRYLRRSPITTASAISACSLSAPSMFFGRDVLAAGGDDDLLLAPGDDQVARLRRACRGRPSGATRRRASRRSPAGSLKYPRNTFGPAHEDLAVVGEAHLDARDGRAHRAPAWSLPGAGDARRARCPRTGRRPRGWRRRAPEKNSSTLGRDGRGAADA